MNMLPIRRSFLVFFLIFVTLGVYYPAMFASSISIDDSRTITDYLNIERIDLKGLFLPGGTVYYYRPLLGLTFFFDKFVWGLNDSLMHLDNIIFHLVNVILVYFIAGLVAQRYNIESRLVPLCAALLFAVHPINTESVNWISGRTDLLAGIFILLSILLLLWAFLYESFLWGAAAAMVFLVACFAKEVAVSALPGFVFIALFFDENGSLVQRLRSRWSHCMLYAVAASSYLLFRFIAFRSSDSGVNIVTTSVTDPTFSLLNTIRVFLKAYGFYLKKLFIPWPLNFAIVQVSNYYVIGGALLVIVIIYMLYKRGLISAFLLFSICLIAPAMLVAIAKMAWTPLAERYLYIPCATFCIAMSMLVHKHVIAERLRSRNSSYLFVIFILLCSVATTVRRNIVWQSNVTLFQDTLVKSSGYYLIWNALAGALQEQGRGAEASAILLSIAVPGNNSRGGKLIESNRAGIMAAGGDLNGARELLLHNIDDSGVLFPMIAEKLIKIDMELLNKVHDSNKVRELRREIVNSMVKMQENSGDPFYSYRIGQFYLGIGNKPEAQRYFAEAALRSPEGAYYKLAAKKLSEKLK